MGLLSAGIVIFASGFGSSVDNCTITLDFGDWVTHDGAVSITICRLVSCFAFWYTDICLHTSINLLLSCTEFVRSFTCQLTMLFVTVFSFVGSFLCFKLVVGGIHLLVVRSKYVHVEDHIQLGNILGRVGCRCQ